MRIEPHENLAVLSIRHDVFGPGRLARIAPGQLRVVEVQREIPVVHVKVVTHTQPTPPADCPPCDRGDFPGFSLDPLPVPIQGGAPSLPVPPADGHITPPAPDADGLTFSHGQAIPATGGMLDIMA